MITNFLQGPIVPKRSNSQIGTFPTLEFGRQLTILNIWMGLPLKPREKWVFERLVILWRNSIRKEKIKES